MQVSTRGRYALRFLLDLAMHNGEGDIPMRDIAERQNISKKYLESGVGLLPTGILHVTRGKKGGYRLVKSPSQITVADVLRATEGGLSPLPCLDNDPVGCERRNECMTLKMWQGLGNTIEDYLSGITLQDIIDDYEPPIEYYI